jgi:hypothetical protein
LEPVLGIDAMPSLHETHREQTYGARAGFTYGYRRDVKDAPFDNDGSKQSHKLRKILTRQISEQRTQTGLGRGFSRHAKIESLFESRRLMEFSSSDISLGSPNRKIGPAIPLRQAKMLLGQGRIDAAREMLRRALERHPRNDALADLYKAITPGRVIRKHVQYKHRKAEFAWIRANRQKYKGKWVALVDDELIASSDNLQEILQVIQEKNIEKTSLVHRVE